MSGNVCISNQAHKWSGQAKGKGSFARYGSPSDDQIRLRTTLEGGTGGLRARRAEFTFEEHSMVNNAQSVFYRNRRNHPRHADHSPLREY